MINRNFVKTLMVLALATVLGFGTNAFAGWGHGRGMGYGRGWCNASGSGYGPGMGYGRGMGQGLGRFGYSPNLSEEEVKKLDEERSAFFESTTNLRNNIFQKRLELRSELAKQIPDVQIAGKLQKEISELEAQFDQKRIDHLVKMKNINPNVGRGFGGQGRSFGAGFGGPCWR